MAIEREVTLKVSTQSDGGSDLKVLVAQLEKIAAQGGEAAPELSRLAAEIQRLGEARQAATALSALEQSSNDLNTAINAVKTRVSELAPQLLTLSKASADAAQAQGSAAREYDAAKVAVEGNHYALKQLEATMRDAGGGTAEMVAEQKRLKDEIKAGNAVVKEKTAALKAANASLTTAAAEERKLNNEVERSNAAIKRHNTELERQAASLAKAGSSAAALGVDVTRLATEEARLGKELEATAQYANDYASALSRAEIEAKQLADSRLFEQQRQAAISAEKAAEYTRWWADALRQADAAAESLSQSRIDEQQRQSAISAQKAAEYTRWWAQALDAANAASKRVGETARVVGESLRNAFSVTGVRSAEAIRAEIRKIQQALQRLAVDAKVTGAEWERANAKAQQSIAKLNAELRGTPTQVGKATAGVGMFGKALGALAGITSVYEIGRQFVMANVEIEKNRRAMVALTGSNKAAAVEMEFVRNAANLMGVEFNGLVHQYTALLAATKGTALEGEKTRGVFTATANALTQMGRGSVEAQHAFMALAQMASKGVVSAEELKQQLSEALPGASQAAARGLGLTTAELDKLVKSGRLMTEDFFPALESGLNDTFKQGQEKVEGLSQSFARLTNAVKAASVAIGDGGGRSLATGTMDNLTASVDKATERYRVFTQVVERSSALLGGQREATAASKAEAQNLSTEMFTLSNVMLRMSDFILGSFNKSLGESVEKQKALTKAAADSTAVSEKSAAEQAKAADAALQNALKQGDLAAAVKATDDKVKAATLGWVGIQNIYAKNLEVLDQLTERAVKFAEAKKIEGDVSVRIAELTGNETKVREAAVAATKANADALAQVATSRANEAAVLRMNIEALIAEGKATNGLSAAKEEQLGKMRDELAMKELEIGKSVQASEAAKIEAAQKYALAEAYKDNSLRVDEYRGKVQAAQDQVATLTVAQTANKAVVDAQSDALSKAKTEVMGYKERVDALKQAVSDLTALEEQGKATSEQVAAARVSLTLALTEYREKMAPVEELQSKLSDSERAAIEIEANLSQSRRDAATSLALYKDALNDAADAAERKIKLLEQEQTIANARRSVDLAQLDTAEKLAVAEGREADAINIKIERKRVEIQMIQASLSAKAKEIEMTIALAQQELRDAEATGELNAEKRFEIESRIRAAEARRIELQIGEQNIAQLDIEIGKLYDLLDVKKEVNSTPTDSRVTKTEDKTRNTADDPRATIAFDYESMLYEMGATVEEAKAALANANAEVARVNTLNPINPALRNDTDAVKRNIERGLYEALRKVREGATQGSTSASTNATTNNILRPTPQQPEQAQSTAQAVQPVVIQIDGTSRTLRLAGTQDVATLETILRQLADGAKRF